MLMFSPITVSHLFYAYYKQVFYILLEGGLCYHLRSIMLLCDLSKCILCSIMLATKQKYAQKISVVRPTTRTAEFAG